MVVQVDTREHQHAIQKILAEFKAQGVKYYSSKLYVGDYMSLDNPRLVIDRKQNLSEVYGNIFHAHDRFKAELVRAQEAGIHLIILVEHSPQVTCLEDVVWWNNPRARENPKVAKSETLYKAMKTMSERYDCEWMFCSKQQTGKRILEILGNDKRGNNCTSSDATSS